MDEIRVCIDECVLSGIEHAEWNDLRDPCPCCGEEEFRHFEAEGGRYGLEDGTPIRRTDYWDATTPLYTQCLRCGEVLYQHPAFDLLFDRGERTD